MFKRLIPAVLCLFTAFALSLLWSCAHPRPPKPGPGFVWVEPHKAPDGTLIKGHWKHTGPARPGHVWVPGHYGPGGKWIPGHWK